MFTVVSIANPVYTNSEGTGIDCDIQFAELSGTHQFHATSYDPEPHGVEIYNDIVAGKYGAISPYVPPVVVQPPTTGTQQA